MRPPSTILVVDDNTVTLKATVRILEQAGYDVVQATDGAAALRQVLALKPSLVLLDVVLPDISGPEVLRQIRADPALARVAVVLMSAHQTMPEQQADGLDAGADGYIAKPIARAELLGRIRSHLRQRELIEQLRASEARYSTLFEYAPDGIVIADPEGTYLDANASACRMVGHTRAELTGLNASDLVLSAEIGHIATALDLIKAGSGYQHEWTLRRKDGSVFPADV
ncbi:MAG: response regulator, partial [Candidatus Saccharimonas sp.]|nr:response regulator [Planctomycetaceae bacterium]